MSALAEAAPKEGRIGAVVDWLVLSIGIFSLAFSIAATVLGGDDRISDASLDAQATAAEL